MYGRFNSNLVRTWETDCWLECYDVISYTFIVGMFWLVGFFTVLLLIEVNLPVLIGSFLGDTLPRVYFFSGTMTLISSFAILPSLPFRILSLSGASASFLIG